MKIFRYLLPVLLLLSVTAAFAGITDLPVRTINGRSYYCYEVQPKETLYSLQNKLGVDRDVIARYNPSVEDGLRAYQTLYFPVDASYPASTNVRSAQPQQPQTTVVSNVTHKVEKGETLYGLANRYGISIDDLISSNPSLKEGLKAGQTIIIPTPDSVTVVAEEEEEQDGDDEGMPQTPSGIVAVNTEGDTVAVIDDITTQVRPEVPAAVSIGVILPFMLNEKTPPKSAMQYTEFYKGLLLAVDSLSQKGRPIHIYAYDSAGSLDTVRTILRRPELKKLQVIIAPPDQQQLAAVGRFGSDNDVMVVNAFIVKEDSYVTNPAMMQAYIPSANLADDAVKAIVEAYGDRTPVILRRSGGSEEHRDFVDAVNEGFMEHGASPVFITYDDKLTATHLNRLNRSTSDFIFLPLEGKAEEVGRFLPAIVAYRDGLEDPGRVMVIGYPSWTTFRGDMLSNMHKANTVIYSRFFDDPESLESRIANDQFRYWYGSPTEQATPRMGLYGLDMGMYLIQSLRGNGGDFSLGSYTFNGVQNGFRFIRPEGCAGWVNDLLYLINYRPSGIIDREDF